MEKFKTFLFRNWLGSHAYIQEIVPLSPEEQTPRTTDQSVNLPYNHPLREFEVFHIAKYKLITKSASQISENFWSRLRKFSRKILWVFAFYNTGLVSFSDGNY